MPTQQHTSPHRNRLLSVASLALLALQAGTGKGLASASGAANQSCSWHIADPQECSALFDISCNWMGCNVYFNETYSIGGVQFLSTGLGYTSASKLPDGFYCNPWNQSMANMTGYLKGYSCGPDYPALIASCVLVAVLCIPTVYVAVALSKGKCSDGTCSLTAFRQRFLPSARTQGKEQGQQGKRVSEAEMT